MFSFKLRPTPLKQIIQIFKDMRKITLLLLISLSVAGFFQKSAVYAQHEPSAFTDPKPETSGVTNLIFSVDPKTNGVNGVFLKEPNEEAQLYKLKGDCYRCDFYEGSIEGPFTVTDSRIKPGKEAVLTIYTVHNLMPGKEFDPGPFPPGSRFSLARTKATVIANQKGSFKLRTN